MKDDNAYCDLIIAACQRINQYIVGLTEADFWADSKTQSAVIMQLQVIGETAKKFSDVTKNQVAVPWKQIIGLRDIISHDYFSLKLDFIWKMANKDVLDLEMKLGEFLKKSGTEYLPPFDDTTSLMD